VKIVCRVCFLSALCLISLSGPCIAEDSTPSPSFQASILSPDKIIPALGTIEPLEPSNAVEPSTSFDPTVASTSFEQDDGTVQTSDENTPQEPPQSEAEEVAETIADPLEPVNRAFFLFNDKLYFWVLKPVATGYKAVIPEDGRIGVHNFFSNFTTPIRVVNCLLQAKFKGAGNETVRFLLNTTFGLAGFFDPAKKEFKIEKQDEDFGQTLGVWGIGPVLYIVWPILGPSSLRDTVGYGADLFLDPRTYIFTQPIFYVVRPIELVNEASLTLGEYEELKKAALDPYIALREASYQFRKNKIKN
jgi:phospholipid-binding lipoprotein MlaA